MENNHFIGACPFCGFGILSVVENPHADVMERLHLECTECSHFSYNRVVGATHADLRDMLMDSLTVIASRPTYRIDFTDTADELRTLNAHIVKVDECFTTCITFTPGENGEIKNELVTLKTSCVVAMLRNDVHARPQRTN